MWGVKASSGRGLPAVWERWEIFGSEHVNRGVFFTVSCLSPAHQAILLALSRTPHIPSRSRSRCLFSKSACLSVARQHAGSAQLSWVVYRWSEVCVYIFKMGFVQESCFYSCAAVFSWSKSHGGKALDRQVR